MKLLLLLFLLTNKDLHHETHIHVWQGLPQALLRNCIPDAPEKRSRGEYGDAWRHSSVNHALLLPPAGVEVQDNHGDGETEDRFLVGCGLP